MVNLRSQKKVAARILKCGKGRVYIDQQSQERVASAITRNDLKGLIDAGVIVKKPVKGTSRKRSRDRMEKKRKGRRRGAGNVKGRLNARIPKKKKWMLTIRSLRKYLYGLKVQGILDKNAYRRLYRQCGGGFFRNKTHLKIHLEKEGIRVPAGEKKA
jgi:large subunit ribosomal protein L19e